MISPPGLRTTVIKQKLGPLGNSIGFTITINNPTHVLYADATRKHEKVNCRISILYLLLLRELTILRHKFSALKRNSSARVHVKLIPDAHAKCITSVNTPPWKIDLGVHGSTLNLLLL